MDAHTRQVPHSMPLLPAVPSPSLSHGTRPPLLHTDPCQLCSCPWCPDTSQPGALCARARSDLRAPICPSTPPGAHGLLPPTGDILTALPGSFPPASQPGSPWRGASTEARSTPRCILSRLPVPFVTGLPCSLGGSRARRQCPSTLPLALPVPRPARPPAAPVPVRSAPGSPRGLFLSPGHH